MWNAIFADTFFVVFLSQSWALWKRSKNLFFSVCELIDMRFYLSDYFMSSSRCASECLHLFVAILLLHNSVCHVSSFFLSSLLPCGYILFYAQWSLDKFKLISSLFLFDLFIMPPNNRNVFETSLLVLNKIISTLQWGWMRNI